MIMARNEDGTYSQVGFVKDNAGIDTEYIYDKDGDIVFEKGFTRETSGTVPLTINGIGKDLKDWSITGNTVQNGTPTPENPVEVQGCGERTGNVLPRPASALSGSKNGVSWEITADGVLKLYGKATDRLEIQCQLSEEFTIPASIDTGGYGIMAFNNTFKGSKDTVLLLKNGTTVVDTWSITILNRVSRSWTLMANKVINRWGVKLQAGEDFGEGQSVALAFSVDGTAVSPFEPYGYKIPVVTSADGTEPITTPIYLPTPLYSGEVMRSDGSREVKWGKLVLTGKETSISIYSGTGSNGVAMIIANMQKGFYQYGFCSHAIVERNHADGTIGLGVNNNTLYWFGILDILGLSASSLAPFKEWLKEQYAAGTPVTVWYRLAKPKTETFTAPQIPTINGTTVIDVDTAVKPTEMYTKYKSSK